MSEPKDVREMRQRINKVAHGYDGIDGEPLGRHISVVSSMARNVLTRAEIEGWSGEDAMTALAYYALVQLEKSFARELNWANLNVQPQVIGLRS